MLYLPEVSVSFVHSPNCQYRDPYEAKCRQAPAQGNAPLWVFNRVICRGLKSI